MINTFEQDLIDVKEVAKHVATLTGKKPNRSLIMRWMRTGTKDKGKLASVKIGRDRFTTKQHVIHFLNGFNARQAEPTKAARSPKLTAKLESRASALGV